MKAVVFHGVGDIRLNHVKEPKIQEPIGKNSRNMGVGDPVVVSSIIACGYCSYCRASYYTQRDNANPNGKQAGTAFFGGPAETGSFDGLQAEYARARLRMSG